MLIEFPTDGRPSVILFPAINFRGPSSNLEFSRTRFNLETVAVFCVQTERLIRETALGVSLPWQKTVKTSKR